MTAKLGRGNVLLVDDDQALIAAYSRGLELLGFQVRVAVQGQQALSLLSTQRFDAIVSDIAMPQLDGIGLLRAVRESDPDVPVVLLTGNPSIETAASAVELGALRYLRKPIGIDELGEVVDQAVQLGRMARLKREAIALFGGPAMPLGDRATVELAFQSAVQGLWMAYQPIVRYSERRVIAYEALLRSNEPRLPNPGALLEAAERVHRLSELGRAVRKHVALTVSKSPIPQVYVNLHPHDLLDEELYAPEAPLSRLAHKVVLEMTERASLDGIKDLQTRVARLRGLGYRLAVDDVGAGYAGLTSIAQLQPEVMKLDMALVRDVDVDSTKQKLIGAMVGLCKEMNVLPIVEGIETRPERDTLLRLGCDVMQGYLFAKPDRPFPDAQF